MLYDQRNSKRELAALWPITQRLLSKPVGLALVLAVFLSFSGFTETTASTRYSTRHEVETPEQIHERAWKQAAEDAARGSEFQKYAIYSSRSLAVANPEVYLKADEAWMKMTYDFSGWGANYLARDRILTGETGWYEEVGKKIADGLWVRNPDKALEPFEWKLFRWEEHRKNAIDLFHLYEGSPTFSILDNRLMFIWSAMKGTKWRMPHTSLAEAQYLEMLSAGKDVYLLITYDRHGFVTEVSLPGEPRLYDPLTGSVVEDVGSDVLLAMNNESVWYPLMERDDTGKDLSLKKVVDTYCSLSSVPRLNEVEAAILSDLAAGTQLVSGSDFAAATMVAMRAMNQYTWRVRPLADMSGQVFTDRYNESDKRGDSPYEQSCIGMVVTEMGNRLCPVSSVWASDVQANAADPRAAFEALGSSYLARFHRTDAHARWVYGDYYRCWLPNLDDKLLSGLGDCIVEATNTVAALALADIDGWEVFETNWLRMGGGGGHVVCGAYTRQGSYTLNNGLFNPRDGGRPNGPVWDINGSVAFAMIYEPGLGFITTTQVEDPNRFTLLQTPYTNMSFDETVAFLERIASLEGNVSFAIDRFTVYKTLPEYIDYMTSNRGMWKKNMSEWTW